MEKTISTVKVHEMIEKRSVYCFVIYIVLFFSLEVPFVSGEGNHTAFLNQKW
jgi:hypothetical protein